MIKTRKQHRKKRKNRRYSKRVQRGGSKTIVIFTLTKGGGFYSIFWFLSTAYIYAKKNNFPFYIEHDNWHYTFKDGWHDYFSTLKVYNNEYPDYKIERYRNHEGGGFNALPIYEIAEFMNVIKEIYVLQPRLQEKIDSKIKEYGTYTSLYIRRGDKHSEGKMMSTAEVIEDTGLKNIEQKIFIQTDDYTAVEEVRSILTNSTILTETLESQRGADNASMIDWPPEKRREDAEQLFVSVGVYLGGVKCWSYYNSNICVFHKLSNYDNVNIFIGKDASYMGKKITMENINKVFNKHFKARMSGLYDNF